MDKTTWISKEELIERAYEAAEGMDKHYKDTLGMTVEWLAGKTTTLDETVMHGYWEKHENGQYYCSACKRSVGFVNGVPLDSYCPNCGAKMDE